MRHLTGEPAGLLSSTRDRQGSRDGAAMVFEHAEVFAPAMTAMTVAVLRCGTAQDEGPTLAGVGP